MSLAGKGTLAGQLLVNNRQTPINMKRKITEHAEKGELYEFSFTPAQPGIHKCLLTFNSKQIKGKTKRQIFINNKKIPI